MGVFEDLCQSEGRSRPDMIGDMFHEYHQIIAMMYRYLDIETKEFESWVIKNHHLKDTTLVYELVSRAAKVSVISVILVFLAKMSAFGLTESEVTEAISKCCDDQRVFVAFSAAIASGGVKMYRHLINKE